MKFNEPKHADCLSCKFYNPRRVSYWCPACPSGEFYTQKEVEPRELDDEEAMSLFEKMERDRNDE